MALVKTAVTSAIPSTTAGVIADQAIEQVAETVETIEQEIPVEEAAVVYEQAPIQAEAALPVAQAQSTAVAVAGNQPKFSAATLQSAASEGFSGLGFDWTSFPSISLKNEGIFADIDNVEYGKEFHCRLLGSKERYVYRANPVLDNKRDVAFSYDRVMTQNGVAVADKIREWEAAGKTVEEKLYLEVMVEMVDPEAPYDGEYRILSISPTSKGRFSAAYAKAKVLGGGDATAPVVKVFTTKVTKVANPFWSWQFEVLKD